MADAPARVFSSGTEYEIFLHNYCERCSKHKIDENTGFPAFPEDGGCPVEDAMENARFDETLFPNKKIREMTDGNGNVVKWHHCIEYSEKPNKEEG